VGVSVTRPESSAVTWHTGPYDQRRAASEAVQAWIVEQRLTLAGPAWDVYRLPQQGDGASATAHGNYLSSAVAECSLTPGLNAE
jgi:hypothetical protein